jgi:hypothetical protein
METQVLYALMSFREQLILLTPLQLGIIAGILQFIGYVFYIRMTLRNEVEPNPVTWLMFAYGVTILAILEFDAGATLSVLILPITCAILAVYVAYLCWHRGTIGWPEDPEDRIAFVADLTLTFAYIGAWLMLWDGSLATKNRELLTLLFLLASNGTTITAFIPLLRGARSHPHRERPFAWILWTCAYIVLAIATYLEHGVRQSTTLLVDTAGYQALIGIDLTLISLMVYPVLNATLHGVVAFLSRPTRRKRYLPKHAHVS